MNETTKNSLNKVERSYGDFISERGALEVFFNPNRVAVVGATESAGSVGRALLTNLLAGPWKDRVIPINPKRPTVLGVKAYPNLSALDAPVDLAVIAAPAPSVPDVIDECVKTGVKGAVIISAGFREIGPEGAALEERVRRAAAGKLRIVGPNCLGVMCPPTGFNATFAAGMAAPGRVAFLSQSGALLTGILDWSLREKVGFSAFVSMGTMLDIGWGDMVDHFAADPNTSSILIYMESVGDARAFMSAARAAARTKPIIVLKPGRTAAAAKAAASHTGSMVGSDDVLDAAFWRAGVLRADTIADLFNLASSLSRQPRPQGPRLTVLTNAGGPGVLAADAIIRNGGALANLTPETLAELDKILPAAWSHGNPVDVLGDAGPDRFAQAVSILRRDPNSDGILTILTPQAMTDPTRTAEAVAAAEADSAVPRAEGDNASVPGKPVLASWMGGASVDEGRRILKNSAVPAFSYPDTAARIFSLMWRHEENLRALSETPVFVDETGMDPAAAIHVVEHARFEGRTLLTEDESKRVLAAYGIPVARTIVASSEDAAVAAAESLGFPVVVKVHSFVVTHKSDGGGVRLNVVNAEGVREAFRDMKGRFAAFAGVAVQPYISWKGYEVILGMMSDVQFGPVVLFGSGGVLTEVYSDRALELAPLNTALARRLMGRTLIHKALQGVRGRPACDLNGLEKAVVRFSWLAAELPGIQEVDINPLVVAPDGVMALDARILLRPIKDGPSVRGALRPYPSQHVSRATLTDGETVILRPIRPEDEPLLAEFHRGLSQETVYQRFLDYMHLDARAAHDRLARVCFTDFDREMALVVERTQGVGRSVVAVGRLSRRFGTSVAELSLLVTDAWQSRGVGTVLLSALLTVGRREGVTNISARLHPANRGMRRLCEKAGFATLPRSTDKVVHMERSIEF